MTKLRVAIIGSGNIGTDLMMKIARSSSLELVGMAGIDPESDGLRKARERGVTVSEGGLAGLLELVEDIDLAFDATSAAAHAEHARLLAARAIRSVDLTPAAMGPAVVPPVNLYEHRGAGEINLITCGAQATIPIVAAVSAVADVVYAETVSTVSSRSAGPGTRQNIDEFTTSTARGLETVGGARTAKAIIILNPADPPVMMRNTIYLEIADPDREAIEGAIAAAVAGVAEYVPGYRLTATPLIADGVVTVMLEVEGAGDNLPAFAGNLDIMTSAAVRVAELYAGVAA
ncbi:MAG: acetaldehyde dehydrogenase (acetylating) [Actinomycetota bacterium]|nr:acetaldehyde dehydrogenase (acetylating) [Actinomycetota bacterium]